MTLNTKVLVTLFGATGDLAARKLYPALYQLYKKNYLSKHFALIGTGRRVWSDDYFRSVIKDSIKDMDQNTSLQTDFAKHFYYRSHDVTKLDQYPDFKAYSDQIAAKHKIGGNRLYYLSMSPRFYKVIVENLNQHAFFDCGGFSRIIVEKPFGDDQSSAAQLKADLGQVVDLNDIFFIDHYLGKPLVQNILTMRFANPLFKGIWNKDHIDNIQITLAEKVGVEERGNFYDKTGALKDMVQNHILQCFSLLTMDQPEALTTKAILEAKVEALDRIDLRDDHLTKSTVRAQYAAHSMPGEESYTQNDKVADDSTTETYVAGRINILEGDLAGIPVFYRTGKKLASKKTRLDIVFKDQGPSLFDNNQNVLTVYLDPSRTIQLLINGKERGNPKAFARQQLAIVATDGFLAWPSDYESLIYDALHGDQVNFAQYEEIEASWKYVDKIQKIWRDQDEALYSYEVYSDGPKEAQELLEQDGHYWIF